MEKRTVLAIVLSMVVMITFLMVQNILYPPPEPLPPGPAQTQQENVVPVAPSSAGRESTTLLSEKLQKGHFINTAPPISIAAGNTLYLLQYV